MSFIITKQMVRDVLTFHGPFTLIELVRKLKAPDWAIDPIYEYLCELEYLDLVEFNKVDKKWVAKWKEIQA